MDAGHAALLLRLAERAHARHPGVQATHANGLRLLLAHVQEVEQDREAAVRVARALAREQGEGKGGMACG